MLRESDIKDIGRIINALVTADQKSNTRYQLERVIIPLQQILREMQQEPEILRKLEMYHTQYGINTYPYINKTYNDLSTFKKEMEQVLAACEKLKNLITEYRQVAGKIPVNSRRQLESLLTNVQKADEAYRLFINLKGRM